MIGCQERVLFNTALSDGRHKEEKVETHEPMNEIRCIFITPEVFWLRFCQRVFVHVNKIKPMSSSVQLPTREED